MKMPGFENGYIAAVTFGYNLRRDDYYDPAVLESLRTMKKETNANTVMFAFHALQSDNNSTDIAYIGEHIPTEDGLRIVVDEARCLGMKVILKPMLDCRNGMWRGTINFFDKDTPPEAKWSDWFANYTEYQCYYADIAERLGADMLCIACEMVATQRRDADWRQCIAEIRKHYTGPITWNADKYQEDEVTFWDALDVISTSGYYPYDDWDKELTRIKAVVDRFQKPFFFAEYGITACWDALAKPNNAALYHAHLKKEAVKRGLDPNAFPYPFAQIPNQSDAVKEVYLATVDDAAQAEFYRHSFAVSERYPFVQGFTVWDWSGKLYVNADNVQYDGGYGIYLKKTSKVVHDYYSKKGYTPIDDLSEPTATDKFPEAARIEMQNRFGKDNEISLATLNGSRPAVRIVNAYYENGSFYVVTHARSGKMEQIRRNGAVAIYCDWFSGNGVGVHLGHVLKEENAPMMEKLRKAFAAWYGNGHTNEADENTVLLQIKLTDGVLFDHGTRYDITF